VRGISVNWFWHDKCFKLGIIKAKDQGNKTRYGKNIHQIRSLFRSQWQKSSAEAMPAEFFMGHTVDPLGYNQAHIDEKYMKKQYKKAEPMLSIMSSEKPFGYISGDVEQELLKQEKTITKQESTISTIEAQLNDKDRTIDRLVEMYVKMEAEIEQIKGLAQIPMTEKPLHYTSEEKAEESLKTKPKRTKEEIQKLRKELDKELAEIQEAGL